MLLPFNKLSHEEAERLALLLEELGEAQQAIGKILRHGYESRHPEGGPTNRESLERELGDVFAATDMLADTKDIDPLAVSVAMFRKKAVVKKYLHHQAEEQTSED